MIIFSVFFGVMMFVRWTALVCSVDHMSTEFKVNRPGQVPVAGMIQLDQVATRSVFECGRLCWNNGDNAGCGGFLYQPRPCTGINNSPTEPDVCQLLEFSDANSLSYGPANASCPEQVYVSTTASFVDSTTTTETSEVPTAVTSPPIELSPSFTYAIPGSTSVYAVTSLADRLFVTRAPSTTNQIAVYNTTTFELIYNITIPGATGSLNGLIVHPTSNYLYVCEWGTNYFVYGVNLSSTSAGSTTFNKWTVCSCPSALSWTRTMNLLVTCLAPSIEEYTTTGQRVRQSSTNMQQVWYAVEVNNETLAACKLSSNQVCFWAISDSSESKCYDSTASGLGSYTPRSLAFDQNGYVAVADEYNNRLLVLNPSLSDGRLLPLPINETGVINNPKTIWLDESRGRLYVGESSGNYRVLVFDNVLSLSVAFGP